MSRLIDKVEITLRKGHLPCLLRCEHIRFVVQGKSGSNWMTLSQIEGNPASRGIGTMLTQTYGGFDAFWAWANWCAGGYQFRPSATVAAQMVIGPTATQGPTCEGSGGPSTLMPSYGHL